MSVERQRLGDLLKLEEMRDETRAFIAHVHGTVRS